MPPQLDELEKIYLWGMQVFGEDPGPSAPRPPASAPHGDREGWESFLREAEEIFSRAWRHPVRPLGDLRADEDRPLRRALRRPRRHRGAGQAQSARPSSDHLRVHRRARSRAMASSRSRSSPASSAQLADYGGDWSMARYIEATETRRRGFDAGSWTRSSPTTARILRRLGRSFLGCVTFERTRINCSEYSVPKKAFVRGPRVRKGQHASDEHVDIIDRRAERTRRSAQMRCKAMTRSPRRTSVDG